MRRNESDELARHNDFRILPECRKVLAVSGDQKVGTSRISALDKDVVVRIARHLDASRWANQMAVIFDELKQLQPQSSPNRQLGPGQHFRIFFEDGRGNV